MARTKIGDTLRKPLTISLPAKIIQALRKKAFQEETTVSALILQKLKGETK